jgi:hypothetical protein
VSTAIPLGRDASGRPAQLVIPPPDAGAAAGVLLVGGYGSGKTSALRRIGQEAARAGSLVVNVAPLDLTFAGEDEIDLSRPGELRGVLDPLRIAHPSLAKWSCVGGARVLLGEEPPAGAAVRDHTLASPITTIRLPLDDHPADHNRPAAEHTVSERVAAAVVIVLAAYALRLAASTPTHTLVLFDSIAGEVIDSTRGRAAFYALARVARARNTTIVLSTLRPDAAVALAPVFGSRLAFRTDAAQEAHTAELLGLDAPLASCLKTYDPGQCLLRDHTGRLTELVLDTPPNLAA